LKSKPTWRNAFGCFATSAFFVLGDKRRSYPLNILAIKGGDTAMNQQEMKCHYHSFRKSAEEGNVAAKYLYALQCSDPEEEGDG
jgi:hypothetical protein